MPDPETLKFYADNAATYVQHAQRPTPQLAGFMARLPSGSTVLELGTGNGRDAAAMLASGFAVTPVGRLAGTGGRGPGAARLPRAHHGLPRTR